MPIRQQTTQCLKMNLQITYDENENTDSENYNIEENSVNEQDDNNILEQTSEINVKEHNDPDLLISNIINDQEKK